MDDTFLVGGFKSFSDLECEFEGFFNGNGAAFQSVGQRVAFDEFQDEEAGAIVFLESVDRCDGCGAMRGA